MSSLQSHLSTGAPTPAASWVATVALPFTRADAVAAGVTPAMLRGSRFRRLFRGVYVTATTEVDVRTMARAALLLHPPGAFASHTTAAAILGVAVPITPDVHLSVFDERDRRPRFGLRSHLSPGHVVVERHAGMPVSSPADTFVAVAQLLSLVDVVIVGDAMVRMGLVTAAELVTACAASSDRSAVAARRAAGYVRDGVDSPMETRLRMLIVLAGLPEPVVNQVIRDHMGQVVMRFDLSYPACKVLVEYDGRQHADDDRQWHRDIERREALDREGWRLIVVTSRGIFREPARTLARIREALAARGAAVPAQLNPSWRPHFTGVR